MEEFKKSLNKILQRIHKLGSKGFSLLELLITLAVFAILLVTTTNIIFINLKASARVKARTYAREESSFLLNILKKDIRNADKVEWNDAGSYLKIQIVEENPSGGSDLNCYRWFQDGTRVERKAINCSSDADMDTSYKTPDDVEISVEEIEQVSPLADTRNQVYYIRISARTEGMPDSQLITKEVAVSTRNFGFD